MGFFDRFKKQEQPVQETILVDFIKKVDNKELSVDKIKDIKSNEFNPIIENSITNDFKNKESENLFNYIDSQRDATLVKRIFNHIDEPNKYKVMAEYLNNSNSSTSMNHEVRDMLMLEYHSGMKLYESKIDNELDFRKFRNYKRDFENAFEKKYSQDTDLDNYHLRIMKEPLLEKIKNSKQIEFYTNRLQTGYNQEKNELITVAKSTIYAKFYYEAKAEVVGEKMSILMEDKNYDISEYQAYSRLQADCKYKSDILDILHSLGEKDPREAEKLILRSTGDDIFEYHSNMPEKIMDKFEKRLNEFQNMPENKFSEELQGTMETIDSYVELFHKLDKANVSKLSPTNIEEKYNEYNKRISQIGQNSATGTEIFINSEERMIEINDLFLGLRIKLNTGDITKEVEDLMRYSNERGISDKDFTEKKVEEQEL